MDKQQKSISDLIKVIKRDSLKVSKETWDILSDFGKLLVDLKNRPVWERFIKDTELPYPKHIINEAFDEALVVIKDDENLIAALESAQFCLNNTFISDDEAEKKNEEMRNLLDI